MVRQAVAHSGRTPLLRCTAVLIVVSTLASCTTDMATAPLARVPSLSLARLEGKSDTAAAAAELRRKLTDRIDKSGFQRSPSTEGTVGVFARQRTTLPPTWGIAISSAGVAIATHLEASTVSVLSVATGAVLGTIPVGSAPTSATFSPGGATAYVANQFSSSISIIDVASRTVSATIDLPTNPYTVMTSRDGARLFVGYNTGGIGVINLSSRTVEKTIALSGNINGLAIDSTGTRLYASSMFGGEVHQIDLTTLSWLRTYTIGGVTQDIALGPNGKRLLVANEAGFITDLRLTTGTMVHTIAAAGAFGMVARPLFEKAIMTIPGLGGQQNYIMLGKLIKPMIAVGGQPRRVAVHGPSGALAITNVYGWVDFAR